MNERTPFKWIDESRWGGIFIGLTALSFSLSYALTVLGGPLRTAAAPRGIISFEFAGDVAKAVSMIESWDAQARVYAGLNLGLDYLYLVAYPCAIGLGCLLVARRYRASGIVRQTGIILSWIQFAAGIFDAVENYALIQLLTGSRQDHWPAIAYWCATPKFAIVAAGMAFVLIGALVAPFVKKQ